MVCLGQLNGCDHPDRPKKNFQGIEAERGIVWKRLLRG